MEHRLWSFRFEVCIYIYIQKLYTRVNMDRLLTTIHLHSLFGATGDFEVCSRNLFKQPHSEQDKQKNANLSDCGEILMTNRMFPTPYIKHRVLHVLHKCTRHPILSEIFSILFSSPSTEEISSLSGRKSSDTSKGGGSPRVWCIKSAVYTWCWSGKHCRL